MVQVPAMFGLVETLQATSICAHLKKGPPKWIQMAIFWRGKWCIFSSNLRYPKDKAIFGSKKHVDCSAGLTESIHPLIHLVQEEIPFAELQGSQAQVWNWRCQSCRSWCKVCHWLSLSKMAYVFQILYTYTMHHNATVYSAALLSIYHIVALICCIALPCIALHCIALHDHTILCITWHCSTYTALTFYTVTHIWKCMFQSCSSHILKVYLHENLGTIFLKHDIQWIETHDSRLNKMVLWK